MTKHRRTAGPVLTLALAAALSEPCWAQEDAARGATSARTAAAEAPRSALEVGPCLDKPGCGRAATPMMPDRSAELQEALREDASAEELPQDPSPVPLPAALALMGFAMAAFSLLKRRPAEA